MLQGAFSLLRFNFSTKIVFHLSLVSSIFLSVQFCYAQDAAATKSAQESTPLELNKPIEREISGEQTQIYRITLSANQYANLTVEQQGIDITARIFAADKRLIAAVDSELIAQGAEKIELVAESGGDYRIEIKPSLAKAAAGKYSIRLLEIREAAASEKSLEEARRTYHEALQMNEAGNFDQALRLAAHAMEIRENILGLQQKETAASMLVVSRLYLTKNNLAQAESFAQRAIKSIAEISGTETLNYAEALTALGRIRHIQSNYTEAEKLHRQALAIREKIAGAKSLPVADSIHNLALLYRAANDYPKAEEHFTKALSLYESLIGENNYEMGLILNNFGLFYYGAGDLGKANEFMRRSLSAKEKIYPPNHRQIGIAYNNLGLIARQRKDHAKAKEYYLRALPIFEIVNGPESDGVASILGNLGAIYKELDLDYAKAENAYQRALAINVKNFGEFHQSTAIFVSGLSILYWNQGDYDKAEQYQLRAQAIYERVLGQYSPNTMLSLGNLTRIYAAKGDVNKAVEYLKRLNAIHQKVIPLNLRTGSERQKLAYYDQTERFDYIITMHAELARDEWMTDFALTALLQHKGRILDAVSENLSTLRKSLNAEDQKLLDNLNEVNARLSKVILSTRQRITAEEQQKQIDSIEEEKEKLESEISRRTAGFYESSQPVTLNAVREKIPADAALVEFAVYRPAKWKARDAEAAYGAPRYIVYVARNQGKVSWKDLGEAASVNLAISEFRDALRDPTRKDVQKLARELDEKILHPVRDLSGEARHLLVSPDGALNLIPFESLVDEKGRYLVENYNFSYLTSGRDLLRMQPGRMSKSNSLVVANPTFGEPLAESVPKIISTSQTANNLKRQSVTTGDNLSETYFAPLSGTTQESLSIQMLFPDATLLTEKGATESALKQITAPRLLHIATHGFFLKGLNEETFSTNSDMANRSSNVEAETKNPLLRSGLALAGANRRQDGAKNDGILTALEASGLNLWGTKLVVLSACDTGIGEVKNGEGVYGLRRAFVLAGTESLVMSLWSVSDHTTRELMTNYYKNLKQGMGRNAALRQVQLDMLKKKGREHPFYWAAFIESGEWGNLDGKR